MRVLTVKQPWAWAIIHSGKDVENRVRNLAGSYRGPLAIHVAMNYATGIDSNELDEVMTEWFGENPDEQQYPWLTGVGSIIGVVDLRATHHAEYCKEADERGRVCSPWAEDNVWHLELANPRPLADPIPWKGALAMRTLPDDVEQLVLTRTITPTDQEPTR
jgi:hypothetical protein